MWFLFSTALLIPGHRHRHPIKQNGDLDRPNGINIVYKKEATTPSVESLGSAKVMWFYVHANWRKLGHEYITQIIPKGIMTDQLVTQHVP